MKIAGSALITNVKNFVFPCFQVVDINKNDSLFTAYDLVLSAITFFFFQFLDQ